MAFVKKTRYLLAPPYCKSVETFLSPILGSSSEVIGGTRLAGGWRHFYNLRVNKDENVYEVFYGGNFSQINIFRSSEYESFKNLPKNTIKEENNYLVSPMPGKVVDVLVKEGDIIGVGKTLIILDAMKMENILKSETKVRVLKVFVKKDEAVSAEQNLIKLKQIK